MKSTPKSCSCVHCLHAKRTRGGHTIMRREERAFRHTQKQALRAGRFEDIMPAVHGSRIG